MVILSMVVLPLSAQEAADSTTTDSLTKELKEVTVQADIVKQDGFSTTYAITKRMREGANNTAQLIGKLPGMKIDRFTNSIDYLGKNKIMILVNGVEKDIEHVKNLSHERFDRMEVTVSPMGRYGDYDVLIDLHLKENYTGQEMYLRSYDLIAPQGVANNMLDMSNNSLLLDYMDRKWNFYIDDQYSWLNPGTNKYYEKNFILNNIIERSIGSPLQQTYYNRNSINFNIDYSLNKSNTVGVVYGNTFSGRKDYNSALIQRHNTLLNTLDTLAQNDRKRNHTTSHLFGVFYKGEIRGWQLNAKVNHVMNQSKVKDIYDRTPEYLNEYVTRQNMDYTYAGAGFERQLTDRVSVQGGYDYIHRKLNINNSLTDTTISRLHETRHYAYIDGRLRMSSRTTLGAGVTFMHSSSVSSGIQENTPQWAFRGRLRHIFSDKFILSMEYMGYNEVPSTAQLSDYGQFVSHLEYSGGNPSLKSNVNHFISGDINFLDMFILQGVYFLAPDRISTLSIPETGILTDNTIGEYVRTQPYNMNDRSFSAKLHFYKAFGHINVNASVGWDYSKYRYKQYGISKNSISATGKIEYSLNSKNFYCAIDFDMPSLYTVDSPQSFTEFDYDRLRIEASKGFFNGSLNIMLRYNIPLHLRSGKYIVYVDSPALKSVTWENYQHLNDNSISISISYRFRSGKRIYRLSKNFHEEK